METVPWQKILDKWNAYQLAANKTAVYPKESLVYPVLGLVGEAGEFTEALVGGDPEKVTKEAGDVLWDCAAICTSRGIRLSECYPMVYKDADFSGYTILIVAARLAEQYKKAIRSGFQAPVTGVITKALMQLTIVLEQTIAPIGLPTIPEIMEINIEKLAARAVAGTLKERGNRPPNPPYIDPKHGQQRG